MAKRRVNKTKAVQEHFEKYPLDKPKTIVAALKKQKISIDPGYVSLILTKIRKKGPKSAVAKAIPSAKQALVGDDSQFSVAEVRLANQLLKQMGGASAAKELIDVLAEIRA